MEWAEQRLGVQADRIRHEVCLAIGDAHSDAVAAQLAQSSSAKDPFGHTMALAQHEKLNERLREIPGIALRKPKGVRSRHKFPVVKATRVVMVPIRFTKDENRSRNDRRLDMSDLRAMLFGVAPQPPEGQRSFEELEEPEIEAQAEQDYQDELAAFNDVASAGRSVIIGFRANLSGVFDFGWGELHIENPRTGEVKWLHWEDLPFYGATAQAPTAPPLRAVPGLDDNEADRFDLDDTATADGDVEVDSMGVGNGDDDDLGLRLRPTRKEGPLSEQEPPESPTGSDGTP